MAAAGAAAAFLANALSYVGLIVVLWRWRPDLPPRALPRERLGTAMEAGVRYAWLSPANLAIGLRSGPFRVSTFVNNVFDQNYVLTKGRDGVWNYSVTATPPILAMAFKPGRDSQRYFGLRSGVSF